jgi:3-deoxy-D-manno-octulosonate 8-phosphate phosphatase KdsC-like HAD superfamily phosphatase
MKDTADSVRIIFICSALEPGRDGVGDYTLRLAAALIQRNNKCAIISLNDRYVKDNFGGTQSVDNIDVPVLRIASILTDPEKIAVAKDYIDRLAPQWLSLQFVPFGFHVKGLKTGLSKLLLSLNATAKWHVMIHELWVGMDKESPIKHIAWGWVQKKMIGSLLKNLKPAVITTQSQLYKQHLATMGYDAQYLPLFSNIPVNNGQILDTKTESKNINLVIFGNIHHGAPVQAFAHELAACAKEYNISPTLKILGHCGAEQNNWIKQWQSAGLQVAVIGEQSAERISAELKSADIGITTTPVSITDKSGSFAAMREHGLPVISVSRLWHARGVKKIIIPDGVFYYQKGNFKEFYSSMDAISSVSTDVSVISQQLSNLLLGF